MGKLLTLASLGRRCLLSLFLLVLVTGLASAQQRTIKGKVSSETEGAIPGANVSVQGTTVGVQTDVNGDYSITVSGPDAVLVFSFIGFTTQQVTVGNQETINVVLASSIAALGEIVVTGYTQQRKREITSSISNVQSDEFNKGNVNRPEQLMLVFQ
ncbi:MAG: carboxypeptidase-like regulatory domain-containing protein [Bacteroidia bacterium]|nr:carboxypeptidase-like regulatory domain-containing protein [Bacteroidia bacterium]